MLRTPRRSGLIGDDLGGLGLTSDRLRALPRCNALPSFGGPGSLGLSMSTKAQSAVKSSRAICSDRWGQRAASRSTGSIRHARRSNGRRSARASRSTKRQTKKHFAKRRSPFSTCSAPGSNAHRATPRVRRNDYFQDGPAKRHPVVRKRTDPHSRVHPAARRIVGAGSDDTGDNARVGEHASAHGRAGYRTARGNPPKRCSVKSNSPRSPLRCASPRSKRASRASLPVRGPSRWNASSRASKIRCCSNCSRSKMRTRSTCWTSRSACKRRSRAWSARRRLTNWHSLLPKRFVRSAGSTASWCTASTKTGTVWCSPRTSANVYRSRTSACTSPASNIPVQARDLYGPSTRCASSPIPTMFPVPIIGLTAGGTPLDIVAFGVAQRVAHSYRISPQHRRSGRNATISIIVRGKLWGLVAVITLLRGASTMPSDRPATFSPKCSRSNSTRASIMPRWRGGSKQVNRWPKFLPDSSRRDR